jgi:hypothetical protein
VSLAKKLNLKDGMSLRVFGKPKDVDLDDSAWLATQSSPSAWRDASRRPQRAGRPKPGSVRASPGARTTCARPLRSPRPPRKKGGNLGAAPSG